MYRFFVLATTIIMTCCFGIPSVSIADGGPTSINGIYAIIEEIVELEPLETSVENLESAIPILPADKRRIVVDSSVYELPAGEEVITAIIRHKSDGLDGMIVINGDGPRKLTAMSGENIFPLSVAIYRLHKQGLLPELTDTYYRYPYETVAKTPVKRRFASHDSEIDFAVTVQGVTWYSRHDRNVDRGITNSMVLITTAGVRLVHFLDRGVAQNPPAEIIRVFIEEDAVQGIINTYPNASLAQVLAFMEMGNIFVEFTIEEVSQINPESLRDKVLQYFERNDQVHLNERRLRDILTCGMVIQMIADGNTAAAAPTLPRGKKLTTWGAIKSGR